MKALLLPKANVQTSSTQASAALAVLRVVTGVAFILHGSGKITAPFSWMGPEATIPGIFQALAALSEFGGGIALILGLLTPLASLGLMITMAVAVLTHLARGDGFVGGYELAAVFFSISTVLLNVGPGRFSLDYVLATRATSAKGLAHAAR